MPNSTETPTQPHQQQAENFLETAAAAKAHDADAETFATLASVVATIYAATAGLPLHPMESWHIVRGHKGLCVRGELTEAFGEVAHLRRERLAAWAQMLGATTDEALFYGSTVRVTARCEVAGIRVELITDVSHKCVCTGQCLETQL